MVMVMEMILHLIRMEMQMEMEMEMETRLQMTLLGVILLEEMQRVTSSKMWWMTLKMILKMIRGVMLMLEMTLSSMILL